MPNVHLVCFCTEKNEDEVKSFIRKNMKNSDKVSNALVFDVHKSFADEALIGRCCGCMDEVEELMLDYTQGKWS